MISISIFVWVPMCLLYIEIVTHVLKKRPYAVNNFGKKVLFDYENQLTTDFVNGLASTVHS